MMKGYSVLVALSTAAIVSADVTSFIQPFQNRVSDCAHQSHCHGGQEVSSAAVEVEAQDASTHACMSVLAGACLGLIIGLSSLSGPAMAEEKCYFENLKPGDPNCNYKPIGAGEKMTRAGVNFPEVKQNLYFKGRECTAHQGKKYISERGYNCFSTMSLPPSKIAEAGGYFEFMKQKGMM